jgi:cytochrome c556
MIRMLLALIRNRRAAALLSLAVLVATTAGPLMSQDRVPGLTGIDRPDDVVQARQLLMDGIDAEMMPIDLATTGQQFPFDDLKSHANTISTMLSAFPHLFPPQTKPSVAPDGSPSTTAAALAIWQDFEDFYGKTQAAAMVAFDASQAGDIGQFRELGKKLRAACDGCHARYMRVDEPPRP